MQTGEKKKEPHNRKRRRKQHHPQGRGREQHHPKEDKTDNTTQKEEDRETAHSLEGEITKLKIHEQSTKKDHEKTHQELFLFS